MAREPCSIIEALACRGGNVVVMRANMKYSAKHCVWHGFCVHQPEAVDTFVKRFKENFETIYVHAHMRDFLADYEDASPTLRCDWCNEHIQYLPVGYHLTPAQRLAP